MNKKTNLRNTVGISAIGHYLPEAVMTSFDIESRINAHEQTIVSEGTIARTTGVLQRHVSDIDAYNSTLAIYACRDLFERYNVSPDSIDLLIFASTGQDILEPATANIIQREIGTSCPVFDVTNACNSFLNALEIATMFVASGKYANILIATGEVPTKSAKYESANREELKLHFPAYVFGDCGTAVLINKAASIAAVSDSVFFTDSESWDVAMFPGGGSRHLSESDAYFFKGDGTKLVEPFFVHTKIQLDLFLAKHKISTEDIDHFFVHQITMPYLEKLSTVLAIPQYKIQMTIAKYGNMAAASIPFAFDQRISSATPKPGSLGLMIGLAGGMSIGLVLLEF
jgi:3-oxoacyl-[acyl-carrier-protein] synthase-3